MANLGFRQAMQRAGIAVVATAVGDRYVLEAMRSFGYTLGGEQSGHLIMSEHATTGDGLLTALHTTAEVVRSGQPLAKLASVMQRFPQVLVNVSGVDKLRVDAPAIAAAVAEEEHELGEQGRVLLRPSGTEPLVRVMVEADTAERAQLVADRLAAVVRKTIG
jgi:phosphoglucosamine mutase